MDVDSLPVARPVVALPGADAGAEERMQWYASIARWAPSKHNAQPWQFVVTAQSLEIWPDPMRWLPETDPHQREMVLSCGAALQLACVAARALGHRPGVDLLPDGPAGPLARLTEAGSWRPAERDQLLLAAIADRRTDRGPLDGSALPVGLPFDLQSEAEQLGAFLRLVVAPGDRATLADLVLRADHQLVQNTHADQELGHWLRSPDASERDGIPTGGGVDVAAFHRVPFVEREPLDAEQRVGADDPPGDRPLLAVLCTPGDDVRDWLSAGRALAAVLLQVARAGGNASYLNQPVAVPAMRVLLREQLSLPGVPQLVLRMGKGETVSAPPRRPLAELVRDGAPPSTAERG